MGLVELVRRELNIQIAAWLARPQVDGCYRLAMTLAITMMEVLNPVVLVLVADLSRIAQESCDAVAGFLRRIGRALGGIGLGIVLPVVLSATADSHLIGLRRARCSFRCSS